MDTLGWILLVTCLDMSMVLGALIYRAVAERAKFRAREQRDQEWDERHGICRS